MNIETLSGPEFWHRELPREIDITLAGVPQELDLPEEFEVQAAMSRDTMRKVLVEMVEDYRTDLQGIEVYGTKLVDGKMQGVARHFDVDDFKGRVGKVNTVESVAHILVKVAGFYAPDYGKVDHPCHQWCKDWGRCPGIQRAAITSLIQHFCSAYGTAA